MHSNQEVYSFAHLPPIRREKGLTSQEALHRIPSIIVDICVAPGLDPTFVPTYLVVPRHWSSWARICDSKVIVYYQVWLDTRIVQRPRRRVEVLLSHSLTSVHLNDKLGLNDNLDNPTMQLPNYYAISYDCLVDIIYVCTQDST